jgi:CRISPR/Cas system CMR subunit Cmr6 (Cas7 group RAMP superfamily)
MRWKCTLVCGSARAYPYVSVHSTAANLLMTVLNFWSWGAKVTFGYGFGS